MKQYEFNINSNDLQSTNQCLLKLWATFLKKGKFAWHYRPYKEKNTINVGDVTIGNIGNYQVLFISKTKQIITKVIFQKHNNIKFSEKEINYFNEIDNEQKNLKQEKFIFASLIKIDSLFGVRYIYPFIYKKLSIYAIEDKQYIEIELDGYSKEEVYEKAVEIFQYIIDFLSTQTNSVFNIESISILNERSTISNKIEVLEQKDEAWMDEYPLWESHLILPKYAKILLNKIVDSNEDIKILKAFHHFSHATKLKQKDVQNELIVSQMMSSVEVLTELENFKPEICEECNQKKYSIRKRVLALIEQEMPNLKKTFDDYYASRSKYLHSGVLISNRNYIGTCLPKISNKSKSGCEIYPIQSNINLLEWIGYLLRKKTKEFVDGELAPNKTLDDE